MSRVAILLPRFGPNHAAMTQPLVVPPSWLLRHPYSRRHGLRARDGSACPHCDGIRIQRWGRFSGRQRYRCTSCGRTFSTFTGTALYYLKRLDAWVSYLWCVDARLTVRQAGDLAGVHRDTAFRWRHRLLTQWRLDDDTVLRRRIVVGEILFPFSAKGSRSLQRPPRPRGTRWISVLPTGQVARVLVARQNDVAMLMKVLGGRSVRVGDYEVDLLPRCRAVQDVVGPRGPRSLLAAMARRLNARYRWMLLDRDAAMELHHVRRGLKDWLMPFRGVATRYLENYLQWFRRWLQGRTGIPPPPTLAADTAG